MSAVAAGKVAIGLRVRLATYSAVRIRCRASHGFLLKAPAVVSPSASSTLLRVLVSGRSRLPCRFAPPREKWADWVRPNRSESEEKADAVPPTLKLALTGPVGRVAIGPEATSCMLPPSLVERP